MNTHYRNKLNFTFTGLDAAKTAYSRLRSAISACKTAPEASAETKKTVADIRSAVIAAVNDDLNYPLALGEMWTLSKLDCREVYELAEELDALFGLELHLPPETATADAADIPQNVVDIAEERFAARKNKDWAKSDALRAELDALGYAVLDGKDGYELKKK